jgi:hypothetical protein
MPPNRYRGMPMTLGNMRENGVRSLAVRGALRLNSMPIRHFFFMAVGVLALATFARHLLIMALGVLALAAVVAHLLDIVSCAFSLPLPKWVNGGSRDEYLKCTRFWWTKKVVLVTWATASQYAVRRCLDFYTNNRAVVGRVVVTPLLPLSDFSPAYTPNGTTDRKVGMTHVRGKSTFFRLLPAAPKFS